MVDPMPELRDAHVALALRHPEVDKRPGDLGSRRAREALRGAVLGGKMGGGHGAVSSMRPAERPTLKCRMGQGSRPCARPRTARPPLWPRFGPFPQLPLFSNQTR